MAVQREIVVELVRKVTIGMGAVRIEVKRDALAARLLGEASQERDLDDTILLDAPLRVTGRGIETRLVIEDDGGARAPDPALIKVVARGHAWFDDLVTGRARSGREITAREGPTSRYVARLLDLAFLPPSWSRRS